MDVEVASDLVDGLQELRVVQSGLNGLGHWRTAEHVLDGVVNGRGVDWHPVQEAETAEDGADSIGRAAGRVPRRMMIAAPLGSAVLIAVPLLPCAKESKTADLTAMRDFEYRDEYFGLELSSDVDCHQRGIIAPTKGTILDGPDCAVRRSM